MKNATEKEPIVSIFIRILVRYVRRKIKYKEYKAINERWLKL